MITSNYNEHMGVCVYQGGKLIYQAKSRTDLLKLRVATSWGVAVTLNGVVISGERTLAIINAQAAQGYADLV